MEKEFEHRVTEVEARSKSNQRRIEKVEERQDEISDLVSSVKVLAEREQNVENDVKEIKSDVKNLTNKPAKKWDNLVEKVLWAVIAAVITFVLAQIGLN